MSLRIKVMPRRIKSEFYRDFPRHFWRCYIVNHFIAAFVAAVVLGYPVYRLMDRAKPFQIIQQSVVGDVILPGQSFSIWVKGIETRTGCEGTVVREIKDGAGILHKYDVTPTFFQDIMPLGERDIIREFVAPKSLQAGNGEINAHVEWWCNVWQKHLWPITQDYSIPVVISN